MSSIDIVVPCYRYGRYLRECVQSVLAQGIPDTRVLIIDDESPDETPQVGAALAAEDSRVTFRRHSTNQGHIATYNEGIEWAAARYMLLLSADDYLLPGALQRALSLMDQREDIGMVFGDAIALADSGASTPIRVGLGNASTATIVMTGREFIGLCARKGSKNFVPTPTAVVRTNLQKQVGGYSAELPHSGDLELWLRLAARASIGYVRREQAVYRRHANNMSLGYVDDQILADLQQRKAALDSFASTCRDDGFDTRPCHAALLRALAREAIGHASAAFNRGKSELSRSISDFALALDPRLRRSIGWHVLGTKRRIGLRASNLLLLPAASMARGVATKLRG